ncbi:hypothetical protein [Paenibacillus glycanilyticus]|uniref:hypothetical protein n=1 Tax=Paenibacillus glycanilyticus TaxID=126569 RepID=UPI0024E12EFD|nr:hypothetical protein [Paenibacillus glycanilyticus]
MSTKSKVSGYSSKQSSSKKCYDPCKKSGGSKHKSSGKKKSSGHKSSGKSSHQHKSSNKCCEHKSQGSSCYDHKSSGCHDNSAIPCNGGEKTNGKSNADYAYGILCKLSLGQVIHRVTLDNGKDLDKVKWAGFQNGNATFSAVSYKTSYIVYVPLSKITSIAL